MNRAKKSREGKDLEARGGFGSRFADASVLGV